MSGIIIVVINMSCEIGMSKIGVVKSKPTYLMLHSHSVAIE